MSVADFDRRITYVIAAVTVAFLVRLWSFGGHRKYSFLFAYALVDGLEIAAVYGASSYSDRYAYVYIGGQAAKALLAVGTVIQVWLAALQGYRGLAQFGRRIAFYILLGALLVAIAGLLLEPERTGYQSTFSHYFNTFDGAFDSMAALFLVASTLFLLWFPVEVTRNTASLAGGLVPYLMAQWAGLLTVNFHPSQSHWISAVVQSLELLCITFWFFSLSKAGERTTTATGHGWDKVEAERLVGKLEEINQRLEEIYK